jgi:hypothetical protein
VAGIIAFGLAVITLRVLVSSRSEFRAAAQSERSGDVPETITHLRRAARWYAPGNPYVRRALAELETIAVRAENGGDLRTARRAWEAIRSAILSARSLYTPNARLLAPANTHIAALLAREEGPDAAPGKSEAERVKWHEALLMRDDAPIVGWTVLALAGLCGWIGGALGFIYRGVGDDDRLRPRAALWSAAGIALGYAAFLLGLSRA